MPDTLGAGRTMAGFLGGSCLAVILLSIFGCGGGGSSDSLDGHFDLNAQTIVVTPSLAGTELLVKPLERIKEALVVSGYGHPLEGNGFPELFADGSIVVGAFTDPLIQTLFSQNGVPMPALEEDAFHLRGFIDRGSRIVVVTGNGPRGVVYALYDLRRRIIAKGIPLWSDLDVTTTPAFRDRFTNVFFPCSEPPIETPLMDPDEVLRMGYNGVVLRGLTSLCTYDDYDPMLYPPSMKELREIVEKDRAYVKNALDAAKSRHLQVVLTGDMLLVPFTAIILYMNELSHVGMPGVLCPVKPKMLEIMEATLDEVFALFPEVDGIQIRFGEVYDFKQTLFGNSPIHGTGPCCASLDDEQKLCFVTKRIRSIVVDKHGKRYNQRAWGYVDSWHSQPDKYLEVVNPIVLDPRLTFSFKQPRTDYWRYNALNPNFGNGQHGQWVEFQCQREYEGKGAFPLYMGRYFAEGGLECAPCGGLKDLLALGVLGGWGWCRGGGWDGPHIEREEWIELNDYALGRLLWDPWLDPYTIAREWLHLKRGTPVPKAVVDAFEAILRLSEEAVLKARYVAPYASGGYAGGGTGWTPCKNWMRDDQLTDQAKAIAGKLWETQEIEEAIQEKKEVVDLADAMLVQWDLLLEHTDPGDPFWTELYHTALYGDSLLRLISHYFQAAFHYVIWQATASGEEAALVLDHLDQWKAEWLRHTQEIPQLPGTATVFQDAGMVDFCHKMAEEIARD